MEIKNQIKILISFFLVVALVDASEYNISLLNYDECYLKFNSNVFLGQNAIPSLLTDSQIEVWYTYGACMLDCAPQLLVSLNSSMPTVDNVTLKTDFEYIFLVKGVNFQLLEESTQTIKLDQYGVYEYSFNYSAVYGNITTTLEVLNHPSKLTVIPIIVMFSILIGLAVAAVLLLPLVKRYFADAEELNQIEHPKKSTRLKSLDVFRGLSVTVMIFVNYGGGGYWYFNHSYWNGLTVADLVFPWFVFIMGIAMPLSIQSLEKRGTSRTEIMKKIVIRSMKLFALGLFINNGNDLQSWRILGVLQRFGVSYLVTGAIMLYIPVHKGLFSGENTHHYNYENVPLVGAGNASNLGNLQDGSNPNGKSGGAHLSWSLIADILPYWRQWLVALALLTVWFCLTFLMPVPGCPTGYIGPGGISDQARYPNCTGGAAHYIDLKIFTLNHIFQYPTCQDIYNTGAYDPEGTLGYLTSIFMCFLGVQAGRIILTFKSNPARISRFLIWAVVLCSIAGGLCGFSQNDGWLPINKNLWTASFVILLAGFGHIVLTIMYVVVDIKKWWNGAPVIFVGMNPITIYCGHEILGIYFPFSFSWGISQSHALFLLSNCIGVGCWLTIAYIMYKKGIFINV